MLQGGNKSYGKIFFSLIDDPLTDLGVVYRLGCCRAEALLRSFHQHQVCVSRHFAAATSALDFIFSRVQNPSLVSRACVRSVCLGSDGSGFWQGD